MYFTSCVYFAACINKNHFFINIMPATNNLYISLKRYFNGASASFFSLKLVQKVFRNVKVKHLVSFPLPVPLYIEQPFLRYVFKCGLILLITNTKWWAKTHSNIPHLTYNVYKTHISHMKINFINIPCF